MLHVHMDLVLFRPELASEGVFTSIAIHSPLLNSLYSAAVEAPGERKVNRCSVVAGRDIEHEVPVNDLQVRHVGRLTARRCIDSAKVVASL